MTTKAIVLIVESDLTNNEMLAHIRHAMKAPGVCERIKDGFVQNVDARSYVTWDGRSHIQIRRLASLSNSDEV